MKIWILTQEYNQYDQYGEYYIAAFTHYPTAEELSPYVNRTPEEIHQMFRQGVTLYFGDTWFNIREEDIA